MFIIFINDMNINLNNNNEIYAATFLFADDTQYFIRASNTNSLSQLRKDILDRSDDWFKSNSLQMNDSKTQSITFGANSDRGSTVKFLGVHSDPRLSWESTLRRLGGNCLRPFFH
ncbi:hypothetical protein HHI36_019539 [Cryptolaemus montrouzieri]|uniref:Reverse transcriptase domain-containing protein n=1 Tax=Cryptolaemus montrouzieri TaxID=559131 RepID=A0ABD2N8F7_9CUCU